jgi:hypothetical protein
MQKNLLTSIGRYLGIIPDEAPRQDQGGQGIGRSGVDNMPLDALPLYQVELDQKRKRVGEQPRGALNPIQSMG